MELIVKGSFERDLSSYTNRILLEKLSRALKNIENAKATSQIDNLVKLKKYKIYYRIQIARLSFGNYHPKKCCVPCSLWS